jgi:hypothetical protein
MLTRGRNCGYLDIGAELPLRLDLNHDLNLRVEQLSKFVDYMIIASPRSSPAAA